MKGIILAGGAGTRLHPNTIVVSKQLLPVYDKPMIYYPISVLMMSGIRDILIITTPHEKHLFEKLLGNGNKWGIQLSYQVQPEPNGLAEAFIIGEEFIGDDSVALILGDNILYGMGLPLILEEASNLKNGATIFGYYVKDPQRYGVVDFDSEGKILSLQEKPVNPRSNYAVVGLYFYDNNVIQRAKCLKPSSRNELEITDLNQLYLDSNELFIKILGRGTAWLDTGTHDSMLNASLFVQTLEQRQGLKISSPEEIAWRKGYIDDKELKTLAKLLLKSGYGEYLISLISKKYVE